MVCLTEGKELWSEAEIAGVDEPTETVLWGFCDMKRLVLEDAGGRSCRFLVLISFCEIPQLCGEQSHAFHAQARLEQSFDQSFLAHLGYVL